MDAGGRRGRVVARVQAGERRRQGPASAAAKGRRDEQTTQAATSAIAASTTRRSSPARGRGRPAARPISSTASVMVLRSESVSAGSATRIARRPADVDGKGRRPRDEQAPGHRAARFRHLLAHRGGALVAGEGEAHRGPEAQRSRVGRTRASRARRTWRSGRSRHRRRQGRPGAP